MSEKIEVASLDEVDLKAGETIKNVTASDFQVNATELKTPGETLIRLEVVNAGVKEYQLYRKVP